MGPYSSILDHKVSGSAASIVPIWPFIGYLRGFWVPSKAPDSPQGPSDRIFLGFSSKRPKPRTPRTPPAGAKNSVRGRFAAEGHQKRPPLERLERSGEFKGVKGTERVFEGGGAQGQNPGGHSYSTASVPPWNKPLLKITHLCHLTPTLPPPVH